MHTRNQLIWSVWLVASLLVASWFAFALVDGKDKTVFMPGPLTDGHHQFADACETCHTDSFGAGQVLQDACIGCHGEQRTKPMDSHPREKFSDPRNADRLEAIDAMSCVTCHTEHRPHLTLANGFTQPKDMCFHCHEGIDQDRPSHAGMAFDTCASAGCHNFHDNRALYTDFLIKHLDDEPTRRDATVPSREFGDVLDEILTYPRDRFPVEPLTADDADAPATVRADHEVIDDWLSARHSAAGVNCSACHQPLQEDGTLGTWRDDPGTTGCAGCHDVEIQGFQSGRHGMRTGIGLAPLRVKDARLPMSDKPSHKELTCTSCHGAHRFDIRKAAVEACLGCHADDHSRAYLGSPHATLWKQEVEGTLKSGQGVSCATCHMPRVSKDVSDWLSRIVVEHNQSANFAPNSKMIRPACLHCHGLGYSIDALADRRLIERNFDGPATVAVETMVLARKDHERYLNELKQQKAAQ